MSHADWATWFLITHNKAVANGEKGGRLYSIECCKCHKQHRWRPNTMSDPHMRKKLMREGWTLERKWNQHTCPQCVAKHKEPELDLPKPLIGKPFLVETWEVSPPAERQSFLKWFFHQVECTPFLDEHRPKKPPPQLQAQWNAASSPERMPILMRLTREETLRVFWQMWNDWDERKHYIDNVIPLSSLPLMRCWNSANNDNRRHLLKWIETNILPKKTLDDHWGDAPIDERNVILERTHSRLCEQIVELRKELAQARAAAKAPDKSVANVSFATFMNNGAAVEPTDVSIRVTAPKPRVPDLPGGVIRKKEFAKELGIAPCSVSGYLKQGMPVRPDGLLNADEAREWVRQRRQKQSVPKHHHPHPATVENGAAFMSGDEPTLSPDVELDDDAEVARLSKQFAS